MLNVHGERSSDKIQLDVKVTYPQNPTGENFSPNISREPSTADVLESKTAENIEERQPLFTEKDRRRIFKTYLEGYRVVIVCLS
jgi:hypothetical protein